MKLADAAAAYDAPDSLAASLFKRRLKPGSLVWVSSSTTGAWCSPLLAGMKFLLTARLYDPLKCCECFTIERSSAFSAADFLPTVFDPFA